VRRFEREARAASALWPEFDCFAPDVPAELRAIVLRLFKKITMNDTLSLASLTHIQASADLSFPLIFPL
jgi:hypothetical protein